MATTAHVWNELCCIFNPLIPVILHLKIQCFKFQLQQNCQIHCLLA